MAEGLVVSPFAAAGVERIPLGLAPRRPFVGRRPFPVLDLRTREEEAFEQAMPQMAFARQKRFIERAYGSEAMLTEEPMFAASDVAVFRSAIWCGGRLMRGTCHWRMEPEAGRWRGRIDAIHRRPGTPRLSGTTAVIFGLGMRNYFHWMTEVLPRFFLLRDHLARDRGGIDRILLSGGGMASFMRESLEALFPDLLPLIEEQASSMVLLERAIFFTDQRFDTLRSTDPTSAALPPTFTRLKAPALLLSETLDEMQAARPRGAPRAVLISRADAATRRLVNEDELARALAGLGIETVNFSSLSLTDRMALLGDVDLVVGVHGAGLTNLLYCRPGTAVIEVTSSQYLRRCRSYADIALHRGHAYALAVVDQVGEQWRIERNLGNDLMLGPGAAQAIRGLADRLLGRTALAGTAGAA